MTEFWIKSFFHLSNYLILVRYTIYTFLLNLVIVTLLLQTQFIMLLNNDVYYPPRSPATKKATIDSYGQIVLLYTQFRESPVMIKADHLREK